MEAGTNERKVIGLVDCRGGPGPVGSILSGDGTLPEMPLRYCGERGSSFHFMNAYEERDEEGRVSGIIVDCCEHNADPTILQKLCLQNLRSFSGADALPDARVGRFRIPMDEGKEGSLEAALDWTQVNMGKAWICAA